MIVQYRLSKAASQDVDLIWLYTIEKWSLNQANHYFRLIFQEIQFVASDFEVGKDIGYIKLGYRQHKVKSHILIYKRATDGVVEIVRILHQKMDIPNIL